MTNIAPMLASAEREPFDSADYVFEVKWDGIRCLCTIGGETIRLHSRTGRDITRLFPELERMTDAIAAREAVLDGELCVLDGTTPSFHLVQRRNVLSADAAIGRAAHEHPALYVVFDLLHLNGTNLIDLPLSERRLRLEHAWRGTDHAILSVAVPERGRDLYAASVAQGLEGIVAKRLDSPYVPGRRTRHWLKIRHQRELDGVIGGYIPRGQHDFASLAIGLHEPSVVPSATPAADPLANGVRTPSLAGSSPVTLGLTYIGNVGTGFPAHVRRDLIARLAPLKTESSPFANPGTGSEHAPVESPYARVPGVPAGPGDPRIPADTQWVQPKLVCRVRYLHFTPGGHLRHPTFLGLREDKHPYECTLTGAKQKSVDQEGIRHERGEQESTHREPANPEGN